jgi:hypothetical protein
MKMNTEIKNYLVNVKTWKQKFDEYLNSKYVSVCIEEYVKFVPIDLKMWNSRFGSDDMEKQVNDLSELCQVSSNNLEIIKLKI